MFFNSWEFLILLLATLLVRTTYNLKRLFGLGARLKPA